MIVDIMCQGGGCHRCHLSLGTGVGEIVIVIVIVVTWQGGGHGVAICPHPCPCPCPLAVVIVMLMHGRAVVIVSPLCCHHCIVPTSTSLSLTVVFPWHCPQALHHHHHVDAGVAGH